MGEIERYSHTLRYCSFVLTRSATLFVLFIRSVDKRAVKEHKKKERKKESITRQVQIFRTRRNKRKYITTIQGLETFDIGLKDASKFLGKKFACGSALSGTPEGGKEIVLQGDLAYDVIDLLEEKYDVPSEAIKVVEKSKSKKKR